MFRLVALIAAIACLAACGMTPAPFPAPASEMADNPGLISGPTGQLVIFSR